MFSSIYVIYSCDSGPRNKY